MNKLIVPSLQYICTEYLIQKNINFEHKICKDNWSDDTTKAVMVYEEKLLDGLIDAVINKVHTFANAYIYGGYLRDKFSGDKFHDIDVRFPTLDDVNSFIDVLERNYTVHRIKENYVGSVSIYVVHNDYNEVKLLMDLTYNRKTLNTELLYGNRDERCDFDVNMLTMANKQYMGVKNTKVELFNVIKNATEKKFIVLDHYNNPEITHKTCLHCINRNTGRGKKLLVRMAKMKSRGWQCMNEPCESHFCIMAPIEIVEKHNEYILFRQNEMKQIVMKKKLERAEKKLGLMAKRLAEKERLKIKREEQSYIRLLVHNSYINGFLNQKRGNVQSYETKIKSKKVDSVKRAQFQSNKSKRIDKLAKSKKSKSVVSKKHKSNSSKHLKFIF